MDSSPGSLFGPLLIGAFFNAILYGVLLVQVYTYYQTYKKDAIWNRILVIYLLILETTNTGLDFGLIYEPLCTRWGSDYALTVSPKLLPSDAVVTAAISVPCQLYFAWRIRVTTQSNIYPALIVFFSFVSLVGGISTSIAVTLLPKYGQFHEFEWAILTWLSSGAVSDLIITVSLVWFLRNNKSGFDSTDIVVNKIIFMTVQTGAITTIAAILDVVVFMSLPRTTIQFIWDFALSKLYSNSLLSTLNARARWNELVEKRKNPLSFIDVQKLNSPMWDPEKQNRKILIQFPSAAHKS